MSETEQLAEPGIPVDALCIGCRKQNRERQRIKRVSPDRDDVETPEDLEGTTFRDVCHHCCGVEYWNVVAVLFGLMDSEEVGE